jgi:hypothetical protein
MQVRNRQDVVGTYSAWRVKFHESQNRASAFFRATQNWDLGTLDLGPWYLGPWTLDLALPLQPRAWRPAGSTAAGPPGCLARCGRPPRGALRCGRPPPTVAPPRAR